MTCLTRATLVATALLFTLAAGVPAQSPAATESVLIRAAQPYDALAAQIQAAGGTVTYRYRYIGAIAAEVPLAGMAAVRDAVGVGAISKDLVIDLPQSQDADRGRPLPAPVDTSEMFADAAVELTGSEIRALAEVAPQAYRLNNGIANVTPFHGAGIAGQGVVVAVIDSGIRPGFPHISLDGSVIGCEDFVGDALGCSHFSNSGHGTFVAGMISSNVNFTLSTASALRNAVLAECPACFANPPVNTQIPMIGTAPLSSIYALRVFGPTGGAPTSRILMAMERAIELRQLHDAGQPAGANIQVVNMSLGGSTLFAGQDLFDQMADAFLAYNIVPVIAAGNAGQASLTVGSPGSAYGAVTVGAASLAHNERILRRVQFGPGVGSLYRPFTGHQTAYFSSRGPNPDGRPDPDLLANGFANYGQGTGSTTSSISLGSGTSFATPSVAGVAALLRQSVPGATARQVRNALIAGANPNLLSDGSTYLDQGAGYVDALNSYNLLLSGNVPDTVPGAKTNKNVNVNIQQNTFLQVRNGSFTESVSDLKPGQRHEIVYRVNPNVSQVVIALTNVTPALPPAQQNQLFGDDTLLTVHSAKTSSIGQGDYSHFAFTTGGTFVVNNPEEGLMRITVSGDWTNAGTISADVAIFSASQPIPQLSNQGKIADQQTFAFPVTIPSGVAQADFRLGWRETWDRYPTADLDLILVAPNGAVNFLGATLRNPEVVGVANPMPGTWTVIVDGFEVHAGTDKYELRVALDGKVVKIK